MHILIAENVAKLQFELNDLILKVSHSSFQMVDKKFSVKFEI